MPSENKSSASDIRYIANALDSAFTLPNGWKIGWDGILGFIPGVGNLITDSFSFYILVRAAVMGVAPTVLARMALNVLIDNIVDKIPGLGFIFDFIWKANTKNVTLMDAYFRNPTSIKKNSKMVLFVSLCALFVFFAGCIALTLYILSWVLTEIYRNIPG